MADEIIVQYRFTDPDTGYADAINLPLEDFKAEYGDLDSLDVEKIEAVKAERVAGWQAALDAPQPEPDPKAEAQRLADEKVLLSERLAVVSADLAVLVEALPVKDRPVVDVVEAVVRGK